MIRKKSNQSQDIGHEKLEKAKNKQKIHKNTRSIPFRQLLRCDIHILRTKDDFSVFYSLFHLLKSQKIIRT